MSSAAGLAFGGGALGALSAFRLLALVAAAARTRAPHAASALAGLVDSLVRLGSEGREPGAGERRRLLLAASCAAFLGGFALAGPLAGAALATAGPLAAARLLRARRRRYRRAVEEDVAQLCVALADALGGGRSLRGALLEAAPAAGGAAGAELRRAAAELAVGAPTEAALEDMRRRAPCERLDVFVAACLLQRDAGGDLAGLLRRCAAAMEDQARLEGELEAATAQARFTGLLVVLLPAGGGLLAELASPGFAAGLLGSFLTAWLVGIAVAMQVAAALVIRRLARPRL